MAITKAYTESCGGEKPKPGSNSDLVKASNALFPAVPYVKRTVESILLRKNATSLAVDLTKGGLPYTFFQGEINEDHQEHNTKEAQRIDGLLKSWLDEGKHDINTPYVDIEEDGTFSVQIIGNDLELISARFRSSYHVNSACSVDSTGYSEVTPPSESLAYSVLFHRRGDYVQDQAYTPIRGLSRTIASSGEGKPESKKVLRGPGSKECLNDNVPSCTQQQQDQQLEEVSLIYDQFDQSYLDGLSYPTQLYSVMLCDGSVVYLLADQLSTLSGNHTILNELPINSADDLITATVSSNKPNDLFGLSLDYEQNGNIRSAEWKSTYHAPRKYTYRYDALNRIEDADYTERGLRYGVDAQDLFSVSDITYDAIGNIQTLTRKGFVGCGEDFIKGDIDVLTYNYPTDNTADNYSQLENIADAADVAELSDMGVKPQTGANYGYDGAGRMTSDPHRGLGIEYNILDLPRKITGGVEGDIEIIYDATGKKRLHKVNGGITRRYAGALVYVKEKDANHYLLEAASTGDGRIVFTNENRVNELYSEYYHKDHLGNVRVAFTDRNEDKLVEITDFGNEVTQINDFYPFGLQQEGSGAFGQIGNSSNRYRYNGKELNEDLNLYDYGARWYDPAIARWTSVDPLASSMASWSPYNCTFNNPVRFIDPDGMSPDDLILSGSKEDQQAFLDMFNQKLAGVASLSVDDNGKVSLARTGPILEGSDEQEAVISTLNDAIDPTESDVEISLVNQSNRVTIADVESGTLDVADLAEYDNTTVLSSGDVATHELAEQTDLQRNGNRRSRKDQAAAHQEGIKAEDAATGMTRIDTNAPGPGSIIKSPVNAEIVTRYRTKYGTTRAIRSTIRNGTYKVRDEY